MEDEGLGYEDDIDEEEDDDDDQSSFHDSQDDEDASSEEDSDEDMSCIAPQRKGGKGTGPTVAHRRPKKHKTGGALSALPIRPVSVKHLEPMCDAVEQAVTLINKEGRRTLRSVQEIVKLSGIGDAAYAEASARYSALVDELDGRLFDKVLPDLDMGRAPSRPPPTDTPEAALSRGEIEARLAIVRQRYLAGVLVSTAELAHLFRATTVIVEGFAVNGLSTPYISPLLNPSADSFAPSMVISRMFERLVGISIRIDVSLLPGHWSAWDNGPRGEVEAECMSATARLCVEGGFDHIAALGKIAQRAIQAARPTARTLVHELSHPVCLLITWVGHLPTVLGWASEYEAVARLLAGGGGDGSGDSPPPGLLQQWASAMAAGMQSEEGGHGMFDVARAVEIARALEKKTKRQIPWEETSALVKAEVMLSTGVVGDKAFEELHWKPRLRTTPLPYSPTCFYLSVNGVTGGRCSARELEVLMVGE